VSYISAPRFECDDGTRIQADSSVHFEATAFSQLFGNVVFRDEGKELNADRAQYFERVGRLQAQGSVRLVNLEDGSWVTGEDLVLLQEDDDRAEDDVTVRGGRPHASIVSNVAPDSTDITPTSQAENLPETSKGTTPYEVDADLIHLVGDRLFQARGRVEVRHETLQSYSDSLEFQQDIGWLTLFDNARVLSQDTVSGDTLDVRGDTITMNLPDDRIDEIEARGRAQLLADGVDMRGPVIRLVFEEEELERVFAVRRAVEELPTPVIGGGNEHAASAERAQPWVLAEDFLLTGDSIEADLPGGELERVYAAGTARGVSTARDSLNTDATDELIRSDWIEGDTIIATFQLVSADSGGPGPGELEVVEPRERQLDQLIARGQARTFYRAAPDSAAAGGGAARPQPLDLHYVVGDEVRLFMKDGEVDRMEVVNPTGAFLQPTSGSAPAPSAPEPGGTPRSPGADDQPPPGDNGPPGGNGGV
jgi:lipopolysaccharide export system protein LptA